MSKDLARNWWGAHWVDKITRLAEPHRFAEGQLYVQKGWVGTIRHDGRTIAANVQRPQEPAHIVRISIDPFSREEWQRLLAQVRNREALAASIAAGDLPLDIHSAYSKAKLRFMPERYVDLHLECACPDWLKPCKHMVAVWLKFARDFDRDPYLVFETRGLKRQELQSLLTNRQEEAVAKPAEEQFPEIAVPLKPEPLPVDPAVFWAAPPLPPLPPETPGKLLLDQDIFGKLAEWPASELQFHQVYEAVYQRASLLRSKD